MCFPNEIWSEPSFNKVSSWRGFSIWQLMDTLHMQGIPLQRLDLVPGNVSESLNHAAFIEAVLRDRVDVVPLVFGITEDRVRTVEFSSPIGVLEIVILSKKKASHVSGDFLASIFDMPTMVMLGVSILVTVFALFVLQGNHGKEGGVGGRRRQK